MNKNKLSVIIPCYNSEKYIDSTIKCLLKQTYKDIEIICIDDCSKDKTYEILENYKDTIKIYKNKKNKGAAFCRNYGAKLAKGDFIGFIDSDDKIDSDYYEILIKEQEKTNSDVVVTDILSIDENNEENQYHAVCCNGEVNKYNLVDVGMAASPCNKIIRKNLVLKYPFLQGKINEDIASIIPIIIKAKKISYTNKTKYYYIQRNNSVQHKKLDKRRLEIFDTVKRCLKLIRFEKEYKKYKDAILYHQIVMLYFFVITKEEDIENRTFLLKKFLIKQFKYRLYKNSHYENFLNLACEEDRNHFSMLIYFLKRPNVKKLNGYIEEFNSRKKF